MAQLNNFSGGLSTKLLPHLININEATIHHNIDVDKGSLYPLKTDKDEDTTVGKSMIYFKNKWVYSSVVLNYVIFQEKLYYTDGIGVPQKSSDGINWSDLGISKPSLKPTVAVIGLNIAAPIAPTITQDTGLLNGYYRYRYSYYSTTLTQESTPSSMTGYKGFTSQLANLTLVPSGTSGIDKIKIYRQGEGLTDMTLIAVIPSSSTSYIDNTIDTSVLGGELVQHGVSGTAIYCYTYYNSIDGSESQPSAYSDELEVNNSKIQVSLIASTDTQIDKIRLYRLSQDITSMSLVVELDNTTQDYIDNLLDTEIEGDILSSTYYGKPLQGLKYLTSHNAMFFAAIDDKLYFSEIAYVNAWSPYYFLDFDEPITGIGATQNGLLVFTEYTTYIITGSTPTSLSKYLLSKNQGCILHNSIQFLSNTLIWLSHDGICASAGSDVQVISRPKLGKFKLLYPTASMVYNDIYYLSHQDGLFVVDFRTTPIFYTVSGNADCFHVKNNTPYYGYNNKLYSMFTGDRYRTLKYRSPNFAEGSIGNFKKFKTIYVFSDAGMIFDIYVDNKKALSKNLTNGINEIKLPTTMTEGYYISFEIQGDATLYEIQYPIEGRQSVS